MSKTDLNKETMQLNIAPAKTPMLAIADAAAKPQLSKPKISATGILIRDGSNTEMRCVPNFEQLLQDMTNNATEITLPERYTFIPFQALACQDLISQQRFSAPTFTPGIGPMQGPPGARRTRGSRCSGYARRNGSDRCDRSTTETTIGRWWRQHLKRTW